jgi:bisphosphoglycerate-dependent phosphoglycerate mutase
VRLLPYWYDMIVPDLHRHGCVLVVSHGNTLRALVKHLEAVSDEAAPGLEVPNAVPLCYEFQAGTVTRLADTPPPARPGLAWPGQGSRRNLT